MTHRSPRVSTRMRFGSGHVVVAFDHVFVELRLAMDMLDKDQIAKAFEHFLATGNLNSKTNLGLRQVMLVRERVSSRRSPSS